MGKSRSSPDALPGPSFVPSPRARATLHALQADHETAEDLMVPTTTHMGGPRAGRDEPTVTSELAAARRLAPTLSARAAEVEAARRLPLDLVDELTAAGLFRMVLPRSHGGGGLALVDIMRVHEELARADGSVAWTVAIGSGCWIDLAGLPRATFDSMYADGPDAIAAGAIAPTGVAVPADGGFRVTGRWAFASGCQHARWLCGNCIDVPAGPAAGPDGDGDVSASSPEGPGGPPPLRMVLFSPDQVEIEDTWYVSGLCGTGSHHFRVDDVFVPADRTFRTLIDETTMDEPILRIPPPSLYPFMVASIAIGIAQGARDEVVALATDKVPVFSSDSLAANPLFQHQLATADAQLRAARVLVHADADEIWRSALAREPLTLDQRARVRSGTTWATSAAAAMVDTAYTAGGGSALYTDSSLQRRLRDIRAVTQHFLVRPDTQTMAGAVFAGQPLDVPVF
jgi:indole-3-acetate monooxygenase